jgi:hypothetical protein
MWYNVGATNAMHKFYVFAAERFRITNTGIFPYVNISMGNRFINGLADPGSDLTDAVNVRSMNARCVQKTTTSVGVQNVFGPLRVNRGTNSGFVELEGQTSAGVPGNIGFYDNSSVRRGYIGHKGAGNVLQIFSEGNWKWQIPNGLEGALVVRWVNSSNVWNQKQLCVAHDDATGNATNTAGEARIAFYNYNNAANGGLRKSNIILQRSVSNNNRNGFRFIDGDSNALCNVAAASYNTTATKASPMMEYADSSQNEVDLVQIIEKLIVAFNGVKAKLAKAEAKIAQLEMRFRR